MGRVDVGYGGGSLGWCLAGNNVHVRQAALTASQLLQAFSQPSVRATMSHSMALVAQFFGCAAFLTFGS